MAEKSTGIAAGFIRNTGSISFQERPVQPSDFTKGNPFGDYASKWAQGEEIFFLLHPFWQEFADHFIMRRAVLQISGTQKLLTENFNAAQLENHLSPGFIPVEALAIPKETACSIPEGEYQLKSMYFRDLGDGFTLVNISYIQYGKWTLLQLAEKPIDPTGGQV